MSLKNITIPILYFILTIYYAIVVQDYSNYKHLESWLPFLFKKVIFNTKNI